MKGLLYLCCALAAGPLLLGNICDVLDLDLSGRSLANLYEIGAYEMQSG